MKKSLTQAIALATAIGAAASAHAVNIDQDGHGQALLYPVYTVEQGTATYVSVTNTTDKYKAVKVRFVEGLNSAEVLDFNLYLSPQDVWTGMVVPSGNGAKLVSNDTSCISANPNGFPAAGMDFVNYQYVADGDTNVNIDRTRVGHLEILEMGDVDPAFMLNSTTSAGAAIKHVNGVPGDCAAVHNAWNQGGVWEGTRLEGGVLVQKSKDGMEVGTGGLYGAAAVVNIESGWSASYDPTALANIFADVVRHEEPGSTLPSLANATPEVKFKEGTVALAADGLEAVSAVLMKESIQNDYMVGAGLNAQTDMVITFPTKRNHVFNTTATQPFAEEWNGVAGKSCDPVVITYYDTEERTEKVSVGQVSPRPPAGEGLALCYETNILHFSGSNLLGGKYVGKDYDLAFEQGWVNIDFTGTYNGVDRKLDLEVATAGDTTVEGLPAIGFAVVATQNGDVGGLLSNYAQTFNNKATTTLE